MSNNYYHFLTPFVPGTKVRSDQVNSEMSGVESGFSLLPINPASMSLGTATLGTDVQGATINDYLVTMPNPRTANLTGDEVVFQATHTNDAVTAATMDVDGIGPVQLFGTDLSALALGDIVSGEFYAFRFTGSVWQMMVPSRSYLAAAVTASINAAASAAAALVSEGNAATSETNAAASATSSQDWAIRVEDDPVPVASGGDGVTTFSALHWAAKSAATAAANIITGTGVKAPTAGTPYDYDANLIYRNANAINTATVGFTGTAGEFRMSNLAYGGFITMNTTDVSGNFARRFGTGSIGNVGIYSDGNTDTETRWLTLYHQNGTERGAFGHLGGSELIIRNSINAGNIRLQSNDTGGVPRIMGLFNPDGAADLYYAGASKLNTTAVGVTVPETALIGSSTVLNLVDNTNPLNIGSTNPASFQHLAFDLRSIQSKASAFNPQTLFINPLGGAVFIGASTGITQYPITMAVATLIAAQATASGAFDLYNGVLNDGSVNQLRFKWQNANIRQIIGSTTGGELRLDNLVNGVGVRLDANDTGGTSRQLFFGDPDGNVDLYRAGVLSFGSSGSGTINIYSTGNTDAETRYIRFAHQDGTLRGFIGHNGGDILYLDNRINGGIINLLARDSGGISRNILIGNPDGGTELYEAGVKSLETYSSGVRVYHPTSNSPTLTLRDSTAVSMAFINATASGLTLSNLTNGGTVTLVSDDAGGTVRNILRGDPDTTTIIYDAGQFRFSTASLGRVIVRGSDATAASNRHIRYEYNSGVLVGITGHISSAFVLRNYINSQNVNVQGANSVGTINNCLVGKPDTDTALFYNGVEVMRTQTSALGGLRVNNTLTGVGFERVITTSDIGQSVITLTTNYTIDTSREFSSTYMRTNTTVLTVTINDVTTIAAGTKMVFIKTSTVTAALNITGQAALSFISPNFDSNVSKPFDMTSSLADRALVTFFRYANNAYMIDFGSAKQ